MLADFYKKFLKLSSWNLITSLLNFATNLLIAKLFGVDIFGDLAYITSLVGLVGLTNIFLPANYAVFKYQEDKGFASILSSYYLISTTINGLICSLLYFFVEIDVPLWLFVLFSTSTAFRAYFDISLQAQDKLNVYYKLLFIQAALKAIVIAIILASGLKLSILSLISAITVAQICANSYYGILYFGNFVDSIKNIGATIQYVITQFNVLKAYYFTSAIKIINSNILVVLFEPIISKETLGLYGLLLKAHTFVFSLLRIFESMLYNKENRQKYATAFDKHKLLIKLLAIGLQFAVSCTYMWFITGSFYVVGASILALHIPTYLPFLIQRTTLLGNFKTSIVNESYLAFGTIVLCTFLIVKFTIPTLGLYALVAIYTLACLAQEIYILLKKENNAHR